MTAVSAPDRSAPEKRRPGSRAGLPGFAGLAGLLWGLCQLGGCWVAPPRAADLLAVGFRTPEQAFRTFQTAVRADEATLEFRCFSIGFTHRNHLSQRTYREGRNQLRAQYPWLRKGIADAEITQPTVVRGERARMQIASHGHRFGVDLVREDFGEVWAGSELVVDPDDLNFEEHAGFQPAPDGSRWFYGHIPWPSGSAVRDADITEIRVGREWKIDGIEAVDSAEHPPVGRD